MPDLGSWKDWFLRPLRKHFGAAPEPWQARPPPQVEPQFRREVTRPPPGIAESEQEDEFPSLSTEELGLLGLKPEQATAIKPYESSDSEDLEFLGWEEEQDGRFAVFKVENEEKEGGYHFSRLRYSQILVGAALGAMMYRPDEDLKALRDFHTRFGQPTELDHLNHFSDHGRMNSVTRDPLLVRSSVVCRAEMARIDRFRPLAHGALELR